MTLAHMKLGCKPTHITPPVTKLVSATELPIAHARGSLQRYCGQNDIYPDCVQAACINAIIQFRAHSENPVPADFEPIGNQIALEVYKAVNGIPADSPAADGTDPLHQFSWWMQNPILGVRLKEWHAIDPTEYAIRKNISRNMFTLLSVCLTEAQQTPGPWEYVEGSPTWGYHEVCCDQWLRDSTDCTSWGLKQPISPEFIQHQVVNAFMLILD